MRRTDAEEPHGTENSLRYHCNKNNVKPVPEIQGKAKKGKKNQSHCKQKDTSQGQLSKESLFGRRFYVTTVPR